MSGPSIARQADPSDGTKAGISSNGPSRRDVLAGSVAVSALLVMRGERPAAADGKRTFTILHTNDLHSNL